MTLPAPPRTTTSNACPCSLTPGSHGQAHTKKSCRQERVLIRSQRQRVPHPLSPPPSCRLLTPGFQHNYNSPSARAALAQLPWAACRPGEAGSRPDIAQSSPARLSATPNQGGRRKTEVCLSAQCLCALMLCSLSSSCLLLLPRRYHPGRSFAAYRRPSSFLCDSSLSKFYFGWNSIAR